MRNLWSYCGLLALLAASCETGGPLDSGSGYDPLDPAGGFGASTAVVDSGFRPGTFVETSMDNAAFFRQRPKGNAEADKLLAAGTPMKVIGDDGNYVKVELDSGEVGYLPPVMLIDRSQSASALSGDEVQIWPLPDGGVAPVIEPLPPGEDLDAPTIPSTIDPDAPVDAPALPDIPDDAPTPGLGIEPPVPGPSPDELPEKDGDAEQESKVDE